MNPVQKIDDIEDERLDVYRSIRQSNLTRWSGLLIAEGRLVVERLLESPLPVESLLVSERRVDQLPETGETPVYVVEEALAQQLVGYNFHAGFLACGRRPEPVPLPQCVGSQSRQLLVACPRVTDPDNLGTILRISAAFGVQGVLLGRGCCDPFSRRTLRVSMGNALSVPIRETNNLTAELAELRSTYGFELLATALSPGATPLAKSVRQPRSVLMLGNEADGLDAAEIALADQVLSIPMSNGTDSLNVAVAAGIFLYHLQLLSE